MNPKFLIIGGTFKSGTSSLFTYLNQVDSINGSRIKETGFFVPARYNKEIAPLAEYLKFFTNQEKANYLMEASPGYLYGGKNIATKVKELLGEGTRMIFLIREPVERFISFYKMLSEQNLSYDNNVVANKNMTLRQYFEACKKFDDHSPDEVDFIHHGLKDGCYAPFLKEWYDCFNDDQIRIVDFSEFTVNPEKIVGQLGEWLNITHDQLDHISYRPVNRFRSHKSGALKKVAMKMNQKFESFFRRNEKLKRRLVKLYEKINTKEKAKQYDVNLLSEIAAYYENSNEKLVQFLTEKHLDIPIWLNQTNAT